MSPEDAPPARLAPALPPGAPRVLRVRPTRTAAAAVPRTASGPPNPRLPDVFDNWGHLQVAQENNGHSDLNPRESALGARVPRPRDQKARSRPRPHVRPGGGGERGQNTWPAANVEKPGTLNKVFTYHISAHTQNLWDMEQIEARRMVRERRAAGPAGSTRDGHWVGTEVASPRDHRHIFVFVAAGSSAVTCLLFLLFQLPKDSSAFTYIGAKVGRGWRLRPIPAPKGVQGSWGTVGGCRGPRI